MRTADVVAINIADRTFVLDDGTEGKVTDLLDSDGDSTDSASAAVAAVGLLPDGTWLAINLRRFEKSRLH